ncbi:RagB/SusD family nutrient uptake outer membrane protein [Flammeovirga pectinis]|uniref:RagB/SusD family nutrient uptake outer membrane protein n=1 Tax=Flammeovirga pectinis TaxID=2494373 RepID=A0A3S9P4N5_9BACT|nr:RagB/SusD family nutrient uptake outer membrane protein [Flammeovirga pectinis]AZQ63104.1 RagB/SusD family nutrient uptake outer membrane protein [Flammeovirga pectinis]
MKLFNKNIVVAILLSASFISCNLDVEPQQNIETIDAADLPPQDLINGLFDRFQRTAYYGADFIRMGDIGTDLISQYNSSGRFDDQYKLQKNPTTRNTDSYRTYDYIYITIADANRVINSSLSSNSDTESSNALGQAHFVRAICYLDLLRAYGIVPLITEDVYSLDVAKDMAPGKADRKDLFSLVFSDLDKAEKLITGSSKTLPSKNAALALKVRALLFEIELDVSKEATNFSEIDKIATDLESQYSIVEKDLFLDYFQKSGGDATILELEFETDESQGSDNFAGLYLWNSVYAGYGDFVANPKILDGTLFGDVSKDIRWKSSENIGEAAIINEDNTKLNMIVPRIFKFYTYKNTKSLTAPKLLRIEEIILTHAEAVVKTNPAKAAQLINDLRAKRIENYIPFTTVTLQDVWNERAKELAYEGHRLWDLRRTKQMINVYNLTTGKIESSEDPTIDGGKDGAGQQAWFPIPEREMNANPTLQSEGNNWGY